MMQEEFGEFLGTNNIRWIEPPWKSILSKKALLPMLWTLFPDHPKLLPAFFEDEWDQAQGIDRLVKKPIFSREGANISFLTNKNGTFVAEDNSQQSSSSDGPYGEEGYIYQAAHMLPQFGQNHTLIGSWLVDDQAAGISMREDSGPITQDMSRFIPHIIL